MSRTLFDAGAFIALDKGDPAMWRRFHNDVSAKRQLVTHAGIVGQVWRKPTVQARLAKALHSIRIDPLTDDLAKATGRLLAKTGTDDVHDGALASMCRDGDVLYTSDASDLVTLLEGLNMLSVRIVPV